MVVLVECVFEVLDEEEMVDEFFGVLVEIDSFYCVFFEYVVFGYLLEKLLMKDFNLNVKFGEMVVIVGLIGVGKIILINLLECFYDISSGSIKYDGVDMCDLFCEELWVYFLMVF